MAQEPGYLAGFLLAVCIASPALAEDPAPYETAELTASTSGAASDDWRGYYFGTALSKPRLDNTWRVNDLNLELLPGDWSGTSMIMTFGHNWQSGRLTYGALVSLAAGQVAASPTSAVFFSCVDCQTTINDLVTLRGRVGYAAGDSLFFASGGLAYANVAATNVSGAVLINEDGLDGWTLGVGYERRIGNGMSVVLSYDHFDLGALDLSNYLAQTESEISLGLMQVGLNVRW